MLKTNQPLMIKMLSGLAVAVALITIFLALTDGFPSAYRAPFVTLSLGKVLVLLSIITSERPGSVVKPIRYLGVTIVLLSLVFLVFIA